MSKGRSSPIKSIHKTAGMLTSPDPKDQDQDKDLTHKDQDKDKDLTPKDKDKDKDLKNVLKESLRTRTRINIPAKQFNF